MRLSDAIEKFIKTMLTQDEQEVELGAALQLADGLVDGGAIGERDFLGAGLELHGLERRRRVRRGRRGLLLARPDEEGEREEDEREGGAAERHAPVIAPAAGR